MKKVLVFMLCVMLVCAFPLATFAEGTETVEVTTEEVAAEITTPDHGALVSTEAEPPEETVPAVDSETDELDEELKEEIKIEVATLTENIKLWIEDNSALIGLIVTIIGYGIVMIKSISREAGSRSKIEETVLQ